jgi:hypothetical protein
MSDQVTPLWSDERMRMDAELIVISNATVQSTYGLLEWRRDSYEAELATLRARVTELEERLSRSMEILDVGRGKSIAIGFEDLFQDEETTHADD